MKHETDNHNLVLIGVSEFVSQLSSLVFVKESCLELYLVEVSELVALRSFRVSARISYQYRMSSDQMDHFHSACQM